MQHRVYALEQAFAHHVHFAAAPFLGRAAVDLDGAAQLAFLDKLLDFEARSHAGGAEQVVAAAVAGVLAGNGRFGGHCLLGQAGQRVELGQHANHGLSAAVGSDEGRGHTRDAGLHHEAFFAQRLLK